MGAAGKGAQGEGRGSVGTWQPLTHHRAVDVALGSFAAHLEDPGAQQVRVGAVGRCVAVRSASATEKQQDRCELRAGPGTHAGRAAGGARELKQEGSRGLRQPGPRALK